MDSLHVLFFTAMVFEFLKCSLNNFSNSLTCFQLLFHWFACKWQVVNWMTFVSFLCHVHCSWCYDQHLNLLVLTILSVFISANVILNSLKSCKWVIVTTLARMWWSWLYIYFICIILLWPKTCGHFMSSKFLSPIMLFYDLWNP